jgi:hypothetical protein
MWRCVLPLAGLLSWTDKVTGAMLANTWLTVNLTVHKCAFLAATETPLVMWG